MSARQWQVDTWGTSSLIGFWGQLYDTGAALQASRRTYQGRNGFMGNQYAVRSGYTTFFDYISIFPFLIFIYDLRFLFSLAYSGLMSSYFHSSALFSLSFDVFCFLLWGISLELWAVFASHWMGERNIAYPDLLACTRLDSRLRCFGLPLYLFIVCLFSLLYV